MSDQKEYTNIELIKAIEKDYKKGIAEFSALKERLRTTKLEIEKFQLMLNNEIKTNPNPFGSNYSQRIEKIIKLLLDEKEELNNSIPLLEIQIHYQIKRKRNLEKEGDYPHNNNA